MATLYTLAACPFCGTTASFHLVPQNGTTHGGGSYVECDNVRCGASSILIKMGSIEMAREKLLERWNARVHPADDAPRPPPTPPRFPVSLRKNWTGTEVQEWIERNWEKP